MMAARALTTAETSSIMACGQLVHKSALLRYSFTFRPLPYLPSILAVNCGDNYYRLSESSKAACPTGRQKKRPHKGAEAVWRSRKQGIYGSMM